MNKNGKSKPTEDGTPEPTSEQWAILLTDAAHNGHLFVRELGAGVQGFAQLLQRLDTGQLTVRKRAADPITAQRAARPEREYVKAVEVRNRLLARNKVGAQQQQQQQHRFANPISNGDLPSGDAERPVYRESFWDYYDAGTLLSFMLCLAEHNRTHPADQIKPYALLLNIYHAVLSALKFLNDGGLFHLDAHADNIFLQWTTGSSRDSENNDDDDQQPPPPPPQLVPVIGDFGYTRQSPEEDAFNQRTWLNRLPAHERQHHSDTPPDLRDQPQRLPQDYARFIIHAESWRTGIFVDDPADPAQEAFRDAVGRIHRLAFRETAIDKRAEADRLARFDLTDEIDALKAAEREYLLAPGATATATAAAAVAGGGEAQADATAAALAVWRAYLAGRGGGGSAAATAPRMFGSRRAALAEAAAVLGKDEGRGPYEVVNVADAASVRAGIERLAASRRAGVAHPSPMAAVERPEPDVDGDDRLAGESVRAWFERVRVPAEERQFVHKHRARQRGDPWRGVVFPDDEEQEDDDGEVSVPGPSDAERRAFREWLVSNVLPFVVESLVHGQKGMVGQ